MKSLASRSLTAVFWGAGGAVARIFLQFAAQIALARILGPEQYGLFAIGAIVVGFSNFFADVGIAYGLIQKKSVTEDDLRFVVTWQFLIGALVSIAMALASHSIAGFFGDDRAADIVKALAIVCLINALAAPSLNLLKRELDFRRIQQAQLLAYIIGYLLVGIPLALAGAKVWALVIAWLVQSTCSLVFLYACKRHTLRPLFWYDEARSLAGYGFTVLITNLTNWFINNIDRVVVGRVFSSTQIGLYATAYSMLYNATSSLLGIVQPVFFSASARVAYDRERIAAAYRSLIGCVALFLLPAFAGLAAVADTFALAVYGHAWHSLGAVLGPLALAMPLFLVWGLTTPLLWTGGEVASEFKAQLPLAIIWLVVSWFAASISPTAVAWAVAGLFLLRFAVILRAAVRLLGLSLSSVWQAVRGGLLLSVACGLSLMLTDHVLRAQGLGPLFRLLLEILIGGAGMLLALRFIPGLVGSDVAMLLHKLTARVPKFLACYLRAIPAR